MHLNRGPSWRQGSRPQLVNQAQDLSEQRFRDSDFCELEGRVSRCALIVCCWLQADSPAMSPVRLLYPQQATFKHRHKKGPSAKPEAEHWSLTSLREKLIKIGAKVVRHGRYVTFQLAEVAVPRELFRKILSLIDDLRRRPAPA